METRDFKNFSPALNREMECRMYGHAGHPILYIPCQDGHYYDFGNFHMDEVLASRMEAGKVMVFSIDTIDKETYSAFGNPGQRIRRHEQWIKYITDEMVPFIQKIALERNGCEPEGVITFGCSLGATHAANLYFRRPDLFDGMLSLSGIYSSEYGFGNYMDELVYYNSPVDNLPNLPADHPYMALYRKHKAVICCGQGAWEQPETTYRMKTICREKGIPVWVDLWGYDVNHDWDWWYKQTEYFLPYILGE